MRGGVRPAFDQDSSCCSSSFFHAAPTVLNDTHDATLASCCQRDLREQQRIADAKQKLLSVDRIDKRCLEARAVLGVPIPQELERQSSLESLNSSDGEEGQQ